MSPTAPRAVPTADTPADTPTDSGTDRSSVMAMLADHVPLTLLLDLALGVRSSEVYRAEPPDLGWLSAGAVSRAS